MSLKQLTVELCGLVVLVDNKTKSEMKTFVKFKLLALAVLSLGLFTVAANANQPPPPPRYSCSILHGEFLVLTHYAPVVYTLRDSSGTYYPWYDWEGPVSVSIGDVIYVQFPPESIRTSLYNAVWIFSYLSDGSTDASYGKMPIGCNFATWKVTGACWWTVQLELVGGGVRLD